MNSKSLLLAFIICVFFIGCEAQEAPKNYENSFNPLTCIENIKSTEGCAVDWHFFFPRNGFPEKAQIEINQKVIIDSCDPKPEWAREDGDLRSVEFSLRDYANLKGSEKFSMALYDRLDCNLPRVMKFFEAEQSFRIQILDGSKQIWVEK